MKTRSEFWLERLNAFSPRTVRLLFWLAGSFFFFGLFAVMTWELHEDRELSGMDRTVLLFIDRIRVARFNGAAVDITALGSPSIILLFTLVALVLLLLNRDRLAALYLVIGSAGAGTLTYGLKHLVSRERPEVIPRLVEVSGFSYPSGHSFASSSFYLIIAFLASRYYKSLRHRIIVFAIAAIFILGVGFSRIYLGVHYPSDVLSGLFLGGAWAFFLTGIFSARSSQGAI
jgi:undecaprenyl-diphosphatase